MFFSFETSAPGSAEIMLANLIHRRCMAHVQTSFCNPLVDLLFLFCSIIKGSLEETSELRTVGKRCD